MNSSNGSCYQVVLTSTGQVFNPIALLDDTQLIIAHSVCCLIGIPFNVSIAVAIVRHRRLRKKPRNIFLLGIILSNLSFSFPAIAKLIYWTLYPIEPVCQSYVAFVGVPQGLLSLNMLLALGDRYFAINHPLRHREKMTVRLASVILTLGCILLIFVLKFVYIVGLAPLRCEVCLVHVQIILIVLTILFVSCTALHFIVYRQTKILLREFRSIYPSANPEDEWIELANIRNESGNNERMSFTSTNDNYSSVPAPVNRLSIHGNKKQISRVKIETTRTLICGLTSLLITTFPPVIFVSGFLMCRWISQSECSHLSWLAPYMMEMGLINFISSPLIFLIRNKELREAMWNCEWYFLKITTKIKLEKLPLLTWFDFLFYIYCCIAHTFCLLVLQIKHYRQFAIQIGLVLFC